MDDHIKAINQLAVAAGKAPRGVPHPMPASRDPSYDFEHLGSTLADSLTAAADEMMANAQRLAGEFRAMAEEIRSQVEAQSRSLGDINARMKAAGDQVLEAHRRFTGV